METRAPSPTVASQSSTIGFDRAPVSGLRRLVWAVVLLAGSADLFAPRLAAAQSSTPEWERWREEFIRRCWEQRGTNCEDPEYIDGYRPLTPAEAEAVRRAVAGQRNRARQEQRPPP